MRIISQQTSNYANQNNFAKANAAFGSTRQQFSQNKSNIFNRNKNLHPFIFAAVMALGIIKMYSGIIESNNREKQSLAESQKTMLKACDRYEIPTAPPRFFTEAEQPVIKQMQDCAQLGDIYNFKPRINCFKELANVCTKNKIK